MTDLVVPSRMNLQIYKQKIVSAKKGHELLKKKCDALKVNFSNYVRLNSESLWSNFLKTRNRWERRLKRHY